VLSDTPQQRDVYRDTDLDRGVHAVLIGVELEAGLDVRAVSHHASVRLDLREGRVPRCRHAGGRVDVVDVHLDGASLIPSVVATSSRESVITAHAPWRAGSRRSGRVAGGPRDDFDAAYLAPSVARAADLRGLAVVRDDGLGLAAVGRDVA
jgi:hypothetical protein